MNRIIRALGILTVVYGFVLAFIIQDANLTYDIAARVHAHGAATLFTYLSDLIMLAGGAALIELSKRF